VVNSHDGPHPIMVPIGEEASFQMREEKNTVTSLSCPVLKPAGAELSSEGKNGQPSMERPAVVVGSEEEFSYN